MKISLRKQQPSVGMFCYFVIQAFGTQMYNTCARVNICTLLNVVGCISLYDSYDVYDAVVVTC